MKDFSDNKKFLQEWVNNPEKAFAEVRKQLPSNIEIAFKSNTKDITYFVIPEQTHLSMNDDDLLKLDIQAAGNVSTGGTVGSASTLGTSSSIGTTVSSIGCGSSVGSVGSASTVHVK
ncbi:hypothetical protein SPONN_954 [uncultured Candidatus Thioglobus sp.]|nr:hypothetical protein SPONN_954 [uncultured Candidatus Thioglobus sp.]